MRVGLVGCVKRKGRNPTAAAELYTSDLFRKRRAFVERSCDRWFILSAKYGLLRPGDVIHPYDLELTQLSAPDRREWSRRVVARLEQELGSLSGVIFEAHAGRPYLENGVQQALREGGATVETPNPGRSFGAQLSFYAERPASRPPASDQTLQARLTDRGGGRPPGFVALGAFLSDASKDGIELAASQIETIIGRQLPASAWKHRAYWGNSESNSQARYWLNAGWEVVGVNTTRRVVAFRRLAHAAASSRE